MTDLVIPYSVIAEQLNATDRFAVDNVKAGRGGPFGASLSLFDFKTQEIIPVGEMNANAVLKTGIASNHAEAMAMSPKQIYTLRAALRRVQKRDVALLFASGGQSCPACHAKQEILSRILLKEKLLRPDRFLVVYGATFQDAAEIARFNDEPYAIDMLGRITPQTGSPLIPHYWELSKLTPRSVNLTSSLSYLIKNERIIATGQDTRGNDIAATREVAAIRRACAIRNGAHAKQPWDLGKPILYTTTESIGPLAYAEALWANVGMIITPIPKNGAKTPQTQEAVGISNLDFFHVIAGGYNKPGSTIQIYHMTKFPNKAQHVWRRELERKGSDMLYNGTEPDDSLKPLIPKGRELFKGRPLDKGVDLVLAS